MSTNKSMLVLADINGEFGYKLAIRNGVPARPFNDPANGEKAPYLIAHDWQHHFYKQDYTTEQGNVDELVAIGAQWYSSQWFVEEKGGFADFVAYQLAAYAKSLNTWYMNLPYTSINKDIEAVVDSEWSDIVHKTNGYVVNSLAGLFNLLTGTYSFNPLTTDDKKVKRQLILLVSKGYNAANKVYKSRQLAEDTYYTLVESLRPYVESPDENSPDSMKFSVNIKKAEVKVWS